MPLFGPPGQRIGYTVHEGPPGSPPLLLLHGFTASAASFVSNIPGLTERFTVITAELLGHGDSDTPEDPGPYAPEPAIDRLLGLLDHLGYEQVLLCGHSLGGALALRFALDDPDRLAGLVVINSNSAAGSPEWRENARANMADMAARVRAEGIDPLRETRLYPAQGTRLPEQARRLLTRDFDRLQSAGVAGTAEALVVDVNAFERLGDLSVPTLVVIGDRDTDFVRNAPRFLVRLPEDLVDTFTIEGAGHAANLEQPELFNEALFGFAERIGYIAPSDAFGRPAADLHADGGATPGDEGLGPTIYEEIGAALGARSRQLLLGVSGAGLVVIGAVMIGAAFLVGGDNNGGLKAVGDAPTATRTPVEQAAGVRATPSPAPSSTAVAAAQPSQTTSTPITSPTAPAATSTSPATPTPRPASTPTPVPTSTPAEEPSPTPTEPPPTATQTPAGRWAAINGPSSGSAGQPLTFSAAVPPEYLRLDWSASNGQAAAHVAAFTVTFSSPGCYSVTLTALFEGGITESATHPIAVDADTC